MNIYISENIKRLRREKNLTQEALADFLGISFQAVSKWECGDAYPDITLLPVIANYFQVTIDELLGNDKIRSEENIQAYLNEYKRLIYNNDEDHKNYKKSVSLAKQAYKEYPYDWRIIDMLCDSFVYTGWNDEEKYEDDKALVRKLCKMVYDECTNDELRQNAVMHMVRLSDGEEEEEWLCRLPNNMTKLQGEEREWNHAAKGRKEEAFLLYQKNVMEYFNHLMWKLSIYEEERFSAFVTPTDKIKVLDISANLLDAIYMGDDALSGYKANLYGEIAQAYFSLGDKENGYLYLEKAVALWQREYLIPTLQDTFYTSPLFNRLTWRKWCPNPELLGSHVLFNALKTSKEFDCVRGEERFKQCVSRLEKVL